MLKKLLMVVATLVATIGFAFADVDVNKANQAALDGFRGIGPAKSKAILEERTKAGNFKDWADLEKRVKGIGAKNAVKLSEAGLTVDGQPKAGTTVKPDAAPKAAAKASASAPAASTPAAEDKMPKSKKAAKEAPAKDAPMK